MALRAKVRRVSLSLWTQQQPAHFLHQLGSAIDSFLADLQTATLFRPRSGYRAFPARKGDWCPNCLRAIARLRGGSDP
jgi:hypothetical protein